MGYNQGSADSCSLSSLAEAQEYRQALDTIKQESGLPESSILDIRGNHDVFDMGQR